MSPSTRLPVSSLSVFDSLHLVDQNGNTLTPGLFQGRFVLLNFIFSHCTTSCPLQTEQLSAVQRSLTPALRSRVLLVSVSVDPENDTPAALRSYGEAHHIDQSHWLLVTGAPAAVGRLTTHFDSLAPLSRGSQAAGHTTDVRLFDTSGRLMQRYAGVPLDKERLIRELTQLAGEPAPSVQGGS